MHPFRQFINSYVNISDKDWTLVEQRIIYTQIKRGTLILEEGKVCRHLYFLESGLLRFFVWKEGNDITKFFTNAPYTFTSQQSFNEEKPAKESIEALEESQLWVMTKQDAYSLLNIPIWNEFVRKLTQEVQKYTEEILEELQTVTAEDRYRKMLEYDSDLLRRVPLKHLASYLGIAPQSLSRIRKKVSTQSGS